MSGKYMKVKRIVVPTLTLILIASQLFGVTACGKDDMRRMSQESSQIEIEYAVPDYDTAEDSKVELLPWLQLASLETHPELRTAFEDLLGVTVSDDGTKTGIIYTDEKGKVNQNNTLFNALGNTNFLIDTIRDAEQSEKIESIASDNYTDIEANQGLSAVINAYFELLPDQSEGQFDGDSTISRAQAMTLLMRAITPVNDKQAPETDSDFTAKVGETTYTDFAAPMNEYCYVNTSNGLNEKSFESTMSRGEYIYMLTKAIFGDEYSNRLEEAGKDETDVDSVTFTTLKDGGDITYQEALNNPDKGLPTEMFNTFKKAAAVGFITEDSLSWDEAITKSEAINLFIDAADFYYANTLFTTSSDGSQTEAKNSEGMTIDEEIDADVDYMKAIIDDMDMDGDYFTKKKEYVKSKGADQSNGAWLIYYYKSGAGNKRSYAINQRTGEKIVAGPYSYFYGSKDEFDGSQPFYGSDKTYPGDEFPEFEENMTLAIEGKPAHTNGQ